MNTYDTVATGKTKIKDHKGGRVWLEGGKLLKAGFSVGTQYSAYVEEGCLFIVADNNGDKRVSGKGTRAIVDLCSQSIGDCFGLGSSVAVEYTINMIIIRSA